MKKIIEESLRVEAPIQGFYRTATVPAQQQLIGPALTSLRASVEQLWR